MPPTQYRPSRRNWIKLWTHEWLTGTVRWQLTTKQRAMWADLLALAGDSRFPGIVTPGEDGGKFIGYPVAYFAGLFRCPEKEVSEAFGLFEQQNRIRFGEGREMYIVNWEKYQSEYQEKRLRKQYTRKSAQVTANVRQNSARLELEGEVEEEGKGEKPTAACAAFDAYHFDVFWQEYPRKVGKAKAAILWDRMTIGGHKGAITGLKLWKQAEQWNRDDGKFIPYASTFLAQKRYLDEPWAGAFEGR